MARPASDLAAPAPRAAGRGPDDSSAATPPVERIYREIEGEFEALERTLGTSAEKVEALQPDERFRHLEILLETSRILNSSHDLDRLLDLLLERVLEVTCGERAFVLLADGDGTLRHQAGRDAAGGRIPEDEAQLSRTIASEVLRSGRGFWATDVTEQTDVPISTSVTALGLRTVICVPLAIEEATLGVLYVDSQALSSGFTPRDFLLIEALASHAAVAIERARLYEAVIHDLVTGLHNYGYFQMRLREELLRLQRYGHPFGLLLVDIEEFDGINEQHGAARGSEILRQVGEVLRGELRRVDILARYGADEFAVILPDSLPREANRAARRLRERIDDHAFRVGDVTLRLSVAVGVVCYPAPDGGTDASAADNALVALHRSLRVAREATRASREQRRGGGAGGTSGDPAERGGQAL